MAFIFLILANLLASVRSQYMSTCVTNGGNYMNGSTFQANLNTLLSNLSSHINNNGFYNASVGLNSDTVNSVVLCRGDAQLNICRSCVQNATINLIRLCPNQRHAILWDRFCMLRYSNEPIFGTLANELAYGVNTQNATSPNEFVVDLRTLLDNLWGQAAFGGSLRKVAAGNINSSDSQTIYAMVQCTPNLSFEECNSCLTEARLEQSRCCNMSIGLRLYRSRCNLLYETSPFYNRTRLQELDVLVPTTPIPSSRASPASDRIQTGCIYNESYTSNSTYQTNLNTLLSFLSTNVNDHGFYNASMGQNPDRVNAMVLCRGDVQLDMCRICIQNAIVDIVTLCPNQRHAILWSEFCMICYSNEPTFQNILNHPGYNFVNSQNVMSPNEFTADLRTLLDNLRVQAASGGSLSKMAAANASSSDSQTIYAMVQCLPNLSFEDCSNCLIRSAQQLPMCCDMSRGVRLNRPSCNLRYELLPFYNETRLQELVPMPTPPMPSPPGPTPPLLSPLGNGDSNISTRIIIVVSVAFCLVIAIFIGFILRKKIKRKTKGELENENQTIESFQCDFGKIRAATDDFSKANELGKGGFGAVYRGKLLNGQEIAVKRLSKNSGQGDLEFKNEVMLLGNLQHRNLVRLLGFSLEGTEKLLVYEFLHNASLDNFIFDQTKRSQLDWNRRYKIIGGIARGLLYLHQDSQLKIIHRDLKPSNILLDGMMNPKIADFGMARLFVADESAANTMRIAGTYGYMAPEYLRHGQFSVKSDVFSFGVLLLEIISGQKNGFGNRENVEDLLIISAWKNWHEGTTGNVIDSVLKGNSGVPLDILRCIHIGMLCVQENATDRPTIALVVQMLSSNSITLAIPTQPAYFISSDDHLEASSVQGFNGRERDDKEKFVRSSVNDVTITELYPR